MTTTPTTVTASAVRAARISGDESQQVFDVVLRTLAEPGSVRSLPLLDLTIPSTLWPTLALADVDVAVTVDDDEASPLASLVVQATGAEIRALAESWFVVLHRPTPALLASIPIGSAMEPERGARVTIAVASLVVADATVPPPADAEPATVRLRLTGPGIAGERTLDVGGLSREVACRLGTSSGASPAGFDTWLVTPDGEVAAISRSTSVEIDRPANGALANPSQQQNRPTTEGV